MEKHMKKINLRKITITGILAAVATVLMYLDISLPFLPSFLKFDFSDMPALLASFSMGPISGVMVCLIKNFFNVITSQTGGVGELSNFLLGVLFVVPAGLIYKIKKTRKSALTGALIGAVSMAAGSLITNYYIVYPIYTLLMPMETIIGFYKAINPNVTSLWDALLWFNLPFTLCKCLIDTAIVFILYKKMSPIIKGKNENAHSEQQQNKTDKL
ncbi:MAG: ECF transporter S component [Oscillospiraceae bacterium]|nr:ECF transporter S component [Oscillospiraceae bacterium]